MRVLVTGVPGWLGGRFLEILVKGFNNEGSLNDWAIRALVLDGVDASFVERLSGVKDIELVRGDVTKKETLKETVKDVDIVFHTVGLIHPRRIRQLFDINTTGTSNMLEASLAAGVRRFVYISSNSAAGTNRSPEALMTEGDAERPYLNYGLSKYRAEGLVKGVQATGKMETVILRPCWFYGPNQPARQTRFFGMIKKGDPIVFGDGKNLRSMTYVDNLARAMVLAAESPRANGQTYWIADERPYPTNEIYQTIAELLEVKDFRPRHLPGFSSEIFLLADRVLQAVGTYISEVHVAGEMNKNIACSIKKAQEELGYHPQVELKEGMRRSLEWCRNNGLSI